MLPFTSNSSRRCNFYAQASLPIIPRSLCTTSFSSNCRISSTIRRHQVEPVVVEPVVVELVELALVELVLVELVLVERELVELVLVRAALTM